MNRGHQIRCLNKHLDAKGKQKYFIGSRIPFCLTVFFWSKRLFEIWIELQGTLNSFHFLSHAFLILQPFSFFLLTLQNVTLITSLELFIYLFYFYLKKLNFFTLCCVSPKGCSSSVKLTVARKLHYFDKTYWLGS